MSYHMCKLILDRSLAFHAKIVARIQASFYFVVVVVEQFVSVRVYDFVCLLSRSTVRGPHVNTSIVAFPTFIKPDNAKRSARASSIFASACASHHSRGSGTPSDYEEALKFTKASGEGIVNVSAAQFRTSVVFGPTLNVCCESCKCAGLVPSLLYVLQVSVTVRSLFCVFVGPTTIYKRAKRVTPMCADCAREPIVDPLFEGELAMPKQQHQPPQSTAATSTRSEEAFVRLSLSRFVGLRVENDPVDRRECRFQTMRRRRAARGSL